MRITVHPRKGLVVSAPQLYPRRLIEKFLQQKSNWIISKLRILSNKKKRFFCFKNKAIFTLLGCNYEINVVNTEKIRTEILLPEDGSLRLIIKTPLTNLKIAEKQFYKWLKGFAFKIIEERVDFYSQKWRLERNRVLIKNQRTLWGSCSYKKNLNFSYRLIQLPLWLIDYVVCHELAHLTHMNHSKDFWALVERYYPDYKKARRYLKLWEPQAILSRI